MKKFFILALLICSLSAKQESNYAFFSSYGLPSNNALLANFKDARIAITMWIEDLGKSHNGKLDVKFYDDINAMYNKFKKADNLDMIVVDMPFYFRNKEQINKIASDFWSISFGEHKYVQYYFIANKKAQIKGFKDIKNKNAALKMQDKDSHVWLDKNSLLANQKTYKEVVRATVMEKKESTALLKVFFNKADFTIISSRTWKTMIELNPAIKKRVQIVKKSKRMHLPFIGIFSKNANKAGVDAFYTLGEDMMSLPESEQIITLLKIHTIFRIEKETLEELNRFYNEYFSLEKKYK